MEKIITKGFLLLIFLGCLSSCNNWLEVSPKSQIKEEKHFSREGGFKDQLTRCLHSHVHQGDVRIANGHRFYRGFIAKLQRRCEQHNLALRNRV